MARFANKQVVQELKEGKPRACRNLLEMYQERLVGEALGVFDMVQEDAEELVSDVLLTVVEKIQSFEFKRGNGDFHFWVMAIFRNRVRDFYKHQAITKGLEERFQESDSDDGEEYSGAEREVVGEIVRRYQDALQESTASSVDGETGEKLRVIAETLEKMESWERVLLRCRALDVPYEDIAEYTGKPVKQLKVYHARVKKKFVKLLAQYYPELAQQAKGSVTNET
ncbi:MAG: sigma-70 family RNA polymerase sigma factor [Bacteroidota bacterium]